MALKGGDGLGGMDLSDGEEKAAEKAEKKPATKKAATTQQQGDGVPVQHRDVKTPPRIIVDLNWAQKKELKMRQMASEYRTEKAYILAMLKLDDIE